MAQTDREALIAFYNATDGPNWKNRTNWDTPADLSDWHGVKVNYQGRVVKLSLTYNNLRGPIPPELGKLGALEKLFLAGNQVNGSIPKELGDLSRLEILWLNANRLTGTIPQELGKLSALRELCLESNKLSGRLPLNHRLEDVLRWVQMVQDQTEDVAHSRAFRAVNVLTSLWHFSLPVLDDITDLWLLLETFGGSYRGLWWACLCVFVVADIERVYTAFFFVALLSSHTLDRVLDVVTCGCCRFPAVGMSFLAGQRVDLDSTANLYLDSLLWTFFGSRARSSPFMRTFGLVGDASGHALQEAGLGLHAIDVMVFFHPFRYFGEMIMSFPRGHRRAEMAVRNVAHRRKVSMVRAVGETLWVDPLFLALSVVTGGWGDSFAGLTVLSALFSVLELVTELQYYVTEAEDGKSLSSAAAGDVEFGVDGGANTDPRSIELVGPSHG